MAMFLYCFRDREDLMDCYEAVSGTRMHATYYRPGGVYRDLPAKMPKYQSSPHRDAKGGGAGPVRLHREKTVTHSISEAGSRHGARQA